MKIKFKTILKGWLITASVTAAVNLLWFYGNIAKTGNPWSDVIGLLPILVMSFATILIGALVYWGLSIFLTKAHIYFAVGAIIVATLSVMGHPKLSNGATVPPEFRFIDIPMHFVAGLLCAFLLPAVCRGKLFNSKSPTQQ
jgi:hypothetical protein